jgi:hypothetical protein
MANENSGMPIGKEESVEPDDWTLERIARLALKAGLHQSPRRGIPDDLDSDN